MFLSKPKKYVQAISKQHFVCFFILFLYTQIAFAQAPVQYQISFENAVHHEARINVTFTGLGNKPLEAVMSRSSPGRYALHEFAKHVYDLEAQNGNGAKLTVTRPNPYEWHIAGHDGTVKLTYTLFGNRADGTYTGITDLYALLNMPATFMWARGLENRPVEITFTLPSGKNWKIATQLQSQEKPDRYYAPDLQYFLDSPTLIGNYTLKEWQVKDGSTTKTIQLALLHEGTEAQANAYTASVKKVVEAQRAVFGELPDYDFGRYTFLAAYLPYVAGDGMEHRNSTVITSTQSLENGAVSNLATLSHEFFHAWNVERIRPASLEPFDFENANMSGELWFAEGFTSYYGNLILTRSGAVPIQPYAASLGANLNFMLYAPGRKFFSAVEMSQQAPFVDAAAAIEPNNRANTYLSYYNFGNMIALALDLTLRKNFNNITLDSYMQRVWQKYGKKEIPYTMHDLRNTLGEITNPAFAADFFNKYIEGKETAPYQELLAQAGMLLRKVNPGKATVGQVMFSFAEDGALITSPVLLDSPLYRAGLETGDVITSIDGKKAEENVYHTLLQQYKPGKHVKIKFIQMGKEKEAILQLAEDEQVEIVLYEDAGMPLTSQIRQFRANWLGVKSN